MVDDRTVWQAVILAGGQGSRLKPLTNTIPKAMVEISGQCIIDHQLGWLARAGVTDVVVSAGHLHDVLAEHLASTSFSLRIQTVVEDEPLGRGGGLKYAGTHLPDQDAPWYALNGDIWTRFDLEAMADYHVERGAAATIGLARPRIPWGVVDVDEFGRVTDFVEAPPSPYPVNGGIYVFASEMLALLPDRGDHERSTFPMLAKQRRLAGFPIEGYWRAIDTAKDVEEAAKDLQG
ncbi:nucleotidyltransferase family protein [Actinobacteria bacterium YIM 96077]|uniref:Nucleotidyltransferase family protein n=1 Tax=Phytoactinopolyspora halophila TaxID=1981511 RepID=A0A329R198_9ACTN|nr:nucleotidyltransferase family protein [Phytoactinopolyspora halophila]AYY15175.1 nucleotidyltransferase family protein [Actinobacteria bacterium YIM 96077]RAW18153.1 nucleotidyltransferase family protein [Phytoactinopolyspora halophila]